MTTSDILPLTIEASIQTAFLFVALWIILRHQELQFHPGGLFATAVVTCVIETIIDYYAGVVVATLIAVPVLIAGLTWVTHAERFNLGVTVAVSYALTLIMNLWVLGTLMGDLKVSARLRQEANDAIARMASRPPPRPATNTPAVPTVVAPPEPTGNIADFSLKGITQSATRPVALIRYGPKTYSVYLGESFSVDTPVGALSVVCKEIKNDRVVLAIGGKEATLTFY